MALGDGLGSDPDELELHRIPPSMTPLYLLDTNIVSKLLKGPSRADLRLQKLTST